MKTILRWFPSFRLLEIECTSAHERATHAEDEVRFWRAKASEYERHTVARESLEDWLAQQHTGSRIHDRGPQLPREAVDLTPPKSRPQKVLARDYIRKLDEERREQSIGAVLQELDEMTRATA